jgi:tRNA pseudouridine55 synthase
MQRYVVVEKPVGQTPLQAIQDYQKADPALMRVPLTYAGRLDPMAQGKLLVLIGEECKKRDAYDGLDKEYLFEVLLGYKTDTGDVLGMPESSKSVAVDERHIRDVAQSLVGAHTLPYPAYSSKTVAGKPLFQYALEGALDTIAIPTADMRVYSMQYVDKLTLSREALIDRVLNKIELLKAKGDPEQLGSDFRKEEICKAWWSLRSRTISTVTILRFRATVSSGTYVRSLAPLIAEMLGTDGLAYSIDRTRIGKYLPLTKHFGFWTRSY